MSNVNFYQVLGVARSASADEIKSAYRELVKRYHPDLYSTAGAIAKATEKLQRFNEAYAVLGDAERRQRYDQESIQQPQSPPHVPAASQRRRGPRPARQANLRGRAVKILKRSAHISKKRAFYALAAAAVVMILIYAGRSVPILVTQWILVEKLEFLSAQSISPPGGAEDAWARLGEYASVSECAGILRERVRKDEQEGSRAVFGEPNGTMAITVFVKKATTAQARENSSSAVNRDRSAASESPLQSEQQVTEEAPKSQENGVTKRVRNLECRATQRLESETWLRRTLKSIGFP